MCDGNRTNIMKFPFKAFKNNVYDTIREIAGTENGVDFDLANPGGTEERAKPATPQTIQSSAAVSYTHLKNRKTTI